MTVVADASGYTGVLTVTRADQTPERRTMTGGSCDEVVEALALTAALSIDPEATVTLGPAAPAPSNADVEAPAAGSRGDDESAPPEDAPSPGGTDSRVDVTLGLTSIVTRLMDHTLHFGGGVLLAVSGAGSGAVNGAATGAVKGDSATMWFPLEARVSVYGLTETATARAPTVVTSFFASRVAYCPVRFVGDSAVGDSAFLLCPVSQVGALSAESRGFEGSSRATRWFATLGLEAWARARIARHVDLWLSPSLEVPLTKRQFAVDPGPEVLASTSALVWGVSAGIGWNF